MNVSAKMLSDIRGAGILPTDSAEVRLQKTLLVFATGLINIASVLWLLIYWHLGPQFSATIPFAYQLLLTVNLAVYFRTRNFAAFRLLQLSLFLFVPFVAQWSMGTFISASGISLWGLLAPIGAVLFIGARKSAPWFAAYLFLTLLSGAFDFLLAENALPTRYDVPERTAALFFALNFSGVSTIVYLLLRHSTSERRRAQAQLEDANAQLRVEQARSQRLLLNVLPGPIAERLKNSNQAIADGFADVSVMFVDIVNFTQVAEGLPPQQVFAILNRIFSSFDELAELHGLEKIKTIGDAYMVAGGLNGTGGNDAEAMLDLAFAMRAQLHNDRRINQQRLEVRIGIGSGPVVAGVVGKRKFIYDLWGDTVNVASRITGEGIPGMIQVDEATFRRLQAHFDFLPPHTIHLKGKGPMPVYRAIGRKTRAPDDAPPRPSDREASVDQ